MPLAAVAAITAAGAIGGAAISAHANSSAAQAGSEAAVKAAQIQADAAQKAADTASEANKDAAQAQLKAAEDALDFQKAAYAQKQQQVAPYIGMGQGALSRLGAGLGVQSVPQPPPVMPAPTAGTGTSAAPPPNVTIFGPNGPTSIPNQSSAPSSPTSPTPGPTLANLGMPQSPTLSASSLPHIGEQRAINGIPAVWDGQGWKRLQQAGA